MHMRDILAVSEKGRHANNKIAQVCFTPAFFDVLFLQCLKFVVIFDLKLDQFEDTELHIQLYHCLVAPNFHLVVAALSLV